MAGAPKGNTNGRGKRVWSSAIRKRIVQRADMDKLADLVIDMALAGDMAAIREIGDRLEGKPHTSVEVSGKLDVREHIGLQEAGHRVDELLGKGIPESPKADITH